MTLETWPSCRVLLTYEQAARVIPIEIHLLDIHAEAEAEAEAKGELNFDLLTRDDRISSQINFAGTVRRWNEPGKSTRSLKGSRISNSRVC